MAATSEPPEPAGPTGAGGSTEDENLAKMLMTTWALRSGRDVPLTPPTRLDEEELIDFWADDLLTEDTGRPTACCGSGSGNGSGPDAGRGPGQTRRG
ncbi:hypothetical protein [Spirillospora sp. NPDC047279]|uniref:hypothetical protein n=1 Tax=Spirillospora sp. NPDC047279 TaxID=3155478 RepID=UPI0033CD9D43